MKRIITLVILTLTIQYSFGQACGVYRIKYVGSVKSESPKIETIKLPTIEFFHGLEDFDTEGGFVETEIKSNGIEVELGSHLTSHLYDKPESLLKLYMNKRGSIPIIVTVIEDGISKEIRKELIWNNIQISIIEDEKFGNLFELNLKEIEI